jgi:hypothetical protein
METIAGYLTPKPSIEFFQLGPEQMPGPMHNGTEGKHIRPLVKASAPAGSFLVFRTHIHTVFPSSH